MGEVVKVGADRGACIDGVGLEAQGHGLGYLYDRTKALMLESDRPIALREALMAYRNGGTVSVIGSTEGWSTSSHCEH